MSLLQLLTTCHPPRGLLKHASFDVMGWYGPVMLTIHSYLQELWKLNLPWDTSIPSDQLSVWKAWSKELHVLSKHPVPIKVSQHSSPVVERQLLVFDASYKRYGGVVYLRQRNQDTSISIALITSKARVAHLKKVTSSKMKLSEAH